MLTVPRERPYPSSMLKAGPSFSARLEVVAMAGAAGAGGAGAGVVTGVDAMGDTTFGGGRAGAADSVMTASSRCMNDY